MLGYQNTIMNMVFLTDSQTFEIFVKHCFVFDPVKEVALSVLAIIVLLILYALFFVRLRRSSFLKCQRH